MSELKHIRCPDERCNSKLFYQDNIEDGAIFVCYECEHLFRYNSQTDSYDDLGHIQETKKIPDGYRQLDGLEIIKKGDLAWSSATFKFEAVSDGMIHNKSDRAILVIRKETL